jgi:hypothetical protein
MENVGATTDRVGPAVIADEVRDRELELRVGMQCDPTNPDPPVTRTRSPVAPSWTLTWPPHDPLVEDRNPRRIVALHLGLPATGSLVSRHTHTTRRRRT